MLLEKKNNPLPDAIEEKTVPFEIKTVTEKGQFTGYAAIFGEPDALNEVIEPGAFTKTLKEGKTCPILWYHDPQQPIGMAELAVDSKGLKVIGTLNLEVQAAREKHSLMKQKVIRGLSFGFKTIADLWDKEIRRLKEIKIYEISPVTFQAHPAALISNVKQRPEEKAALRKELRIEILDEIEEEAKGRSNRIEEFEKTKKELEKKLGRIDENKERLNMIETIMNRPPVSTDRCYKAADGTLLALRPHEEPPPGHSLFIPGTEHKAKAITSNRFHYEVKSAYDKAFFDVYLRLGMKHLSATEQKALLIGSDPSAGYLTSIEYGREIIKGITEFSPIRAEATVRSTSGTEINFPKRTVLPDTHWIGEISERVEDESAEYGLEKLTPHEMISFKKVSLQQLEDSVFNLAEELGEAFGEAMGLKEGTGFISGSGVLQPEGILVNPDVGETETLVASVIGPNDIQAFPYTIGRGYRRNGKWYMNDTTIAAIRLLRADVAAEGDGLGPFLWQNSLIGGEPPTLAGYPVISCPDMPDIADNAWPIAFGDMRKAYLIADRIIFTIQELRERYAEYGMIGYIARKRVDGQVVLPAAIRKLKIKAGA